MNTEKRIRVLIVDDNSLLRLGLSEAIGGEGDLEVVGEAENGREARELFRELRPEVVTMDYQMPGETGVETTRQIISEYPEAVVILLSVFEGEEDVWSAEQAGAKGYLNKSAAIDEVLEAIREVAAGNNYFPAAIAQKIAKREGRASLTARELEVLKLVVQGNSNKEIMHLLNISEGMTKLHVSNILSKLNAADRTQAAIMAVKQGIVHLES
ncbi:MAG: response regulator transcription factor [Verrucomicrobiota bacterium]